jgi:hypothetical protein
MFVAQNQPVARRCAPNSCGFRTLGNSGVQLRYKTEQAYGKMRQAWRLPFPPSSGSSPNTCASKATAREKYSRANSVRLAVKTGSVLSLANRMACSALSRKYDASVIGLAAGSGGSTKNSQSPITAEDGSMKSQTSFRYVRFRTLSDLSWVPVGREAVQVSAPQVSANCKPLGPQPVHVITRVQFAVVFYEVPLFLSFPKRAPVRQHAR